MSDKAITANLTGMADILMPMTPVPNGSSWAYWLVLAVLLSSLLLLWRHRSNPLSRIQRQLQQGSLGARDAAHQLAQKDIINSELSLQLDRLRFARNTPKTADVLALMKEVVRER